MDFDKLGLFYLGRDEAKAPVLLESRHLTTHGVIVGMTGSGKTGLGIGLLEEALIDNIPVLAVDPKGDLGNLLLTFEDPTGERLAPFADPGAAATAGLSVADHAAAEAARWKQGWADSGQSGERVQRLRRAVELALYTPGSSAGRPVCALRSFDAPVEATRADPDLLRDRIENATASLLALGGLEVESIAREHVLIANLLQHAWLAGRDLDLAALIGGIQTPPFERVGVLDVEQFFPARERFALAARLNNLLASPGFAAWLTGEPLDVQRLLFTEQGRPRAAIMSIAHLSESERMFFVTLLMSEVLAWSRAQGGTSSLRALIYIDEVFGYLPPVAQPPSKRPLLTLLKQARAAGVGVVLATQNPVDLDYKALSNAGTWMIGRLQTERDRDRLLDGLRAASGGTDLAALETAIAGLHKRQFLLHSVHRPEPEVFRTRWTLSYLAGPLTREQIRRLADAPAPPEDATAPSPVAPASLPTAPPPVEPEVRMAFVTPGPGRQASHYRPAVAARVEVTWLSKRHGVSRQESLWLVTAVRDEVAAVDWDAAATLSLDAESLALEAPDGVTFEALPAVAGRAESFTAWRKALLRSIRLRRPLVLWRCAAPDLTSDPGESEAAFRARLALLARERRDAQADALRKRYASKLRTAERRVQRAAQALDREEGQVRSRQVDAALSVGSAILGAFLGRKVVSQRNVSRVGSAVRSAGRASQEREDAARAAERLSSAQAEHADLASELDADLAALDDALDPATLSLEAVEIRAKERDMVVRFLGLLWLPHEASGGHQAPAW